jgi:hypothetical protein
MSDDLDAALRRHFANAEQPLTDGEFASRLARRLVAERRWRPNLRGPYAVLGTIVSGLGLARSALRLKHARLMIMGAAAVTVWVSFL